MQATGHGCAGRSLNRTCPYVSAGSACLGSRPSSAGPIRPLDVVVEKIHAAKPTPGEAAKAFGKVTTEAVNSGWPVSLSGSPFFAAFVRVRPFDVELMLSPSRRWALSELTSAREFSASERSDDSRACPQELVSRARLPEKEPGPRSLNLRR